MCTLSFWWFFFQSNEEKIKLNTHLTRQATHWTSMFSANNKPFQLLSAIFFNNQLQQLVFFSISGVRHWKLVYTHWLNGMQLSSISWKQFRVVHVLLHFALSLSSSLHGYFVIISVLVSVFAWATLFLCIHETAWQRWSVVKKLHTLHNQIKRDRFMFKIQR